MLPKIGGHFRIYFTIHEIVLRFYKVFKIMTNNNFSKLSLILSNNLNTNSKLYEVFKNAFDNKIEFVIFNSDDVDMLRCVYIKRMNQITDSLPEDMQGDVNYIQYIHNKENEDLFNDLIVNFSNPGVLISTAPHIFKINMNTKIITYLAEDGKKNSYLADYVEELLIILKENAKKDA